MENAEPQDLRHKTYAFVRQNPGLTELEAQALVANDSIWGVYPRGSLANVAEKTYRIHTSSM